jgi:hypothetical protein
MATRTWVDALAAVFLLAVITILVRPNSLAPRFLTDFGTAVDNMIHFAVTG